ncbi:MAG TPA: hypothetical protein VKI40_11255 [Terriglobales bacterium]|nr:hypothetical protein [Terriglobales bacterium]
MFWPLTIAQSHTRATAVLVDELDPSALERCADGLNGFFRYRPSGSLKIDDRRMP